MARINEQIGESVVRLVAEDGTQLGVVSAADARAYAYELDLDLVGDPARARNEHLTALDADTGLLMLQISDEEILAALEDRVERSTRTCRRCGARLPAHRHRCSRCRLPHR